jgi:hypothetical protein
MLNGLFRPAAPSARARLSGLAACAWIAWMPAHAESASPEQAVSALFAQYQGWRDEPLQDWRKANERVGEVGGWRTYLRESQQDGDGPDSGTGQPGDHGH